MASGALDGLRMMRSIARFSIDRNNFQRAACRQCRPCTSSLLTLIALEELCHGVQPMSAAQFFHINSFEGALSEGGIWMQSCAVRHLHEWQEHFQRTGSKRCE
eukprot:6432902-Amphidinium_carterae.1